MKALEGIAIYGLSDGLGRRWPPWRIPPPWWPKNTSGAGIPLPDAYLVKYHKRGRVLPGIRKTPRGIHGKRIPREICRAFAQFPCEVPEFPGIYTGHFPGKGCCGKKNWRCWGKETFLRSNNIQTVQMNIAIQLITGQFLL